MFIEPFANNEFLRLSLVAGILVAFTCAIAGTFVVLRGLAFIGDALAHGVLPGIATAMLLGVSGVIGAAVGSLVMMAGVSVVSRRFRLSGDTAIGLLFVGMLALGVFLINGTPVAWQSRKQQTVSRSTDEAEYQAMATAASMGLWLRKLLAEIEAHAKKLQMFADNQAAIEHVHSPGAISGRASTLISPTSLSWIGRPGVTWISPMCPLLITLLTSSPRVW